ncbi:MAG: radical SAM protein [Deltaproteobacteria bacterium]|nr:radical SAM protein [Deltaproteobacteria bacterium]
MLSVSKLLSDSPLKEKQTESARYCRAQSPVIVWNITKSCALHCVHCYNNSEEKIYPGELSTEECLRVIHHLSEFKVPAIIFSGGDPLQRPDIFTLMACAKDKGIRPILSTSGISIAKETARRIKKSGVAYVGISLDGGETINDRLRGMKGAFQKALDALKFCRDIGLVTGVRFTMSKKTIAELPAIFELIEKENIPRGYFAHLVYSGRGERFSREDLTKEETRKAIDYIFDRSEEFIKKGLKKDIVTGSNDADGVYLYLRLKKCNPAKAQLVFGLLLGRGGNSSGVSLGNIDNLGSVHADQFWQQYSFGNVKDKPFGKIWSDTSNTLMKALKHRKGLINGRCSKCKYFDICGGSYRVRAEFSTGDKWAEDPACYLTDEELEL